MLPFPPSSQSPDRPPLRLLCLSNGHGEDAIAAQILQALQQQPDPPKLSALPIVGAGRAYAKLGIPLIGPVKTMPSGGFIQDGRQLARDVQGGLVKLTLGQMGALRSWVAAGEAGGQGGRGAGEESSRSLVLAVGDVVPLAMACWSGADYGFVGTAKSEYYVRDEAGLLARSSWWDDRVERWTGCVYLPWERWLLSRSRCRAVFPRDELTAETLRRSNVPAFGLGNPMMDGLEPMSQRIDRHSLMVTLLPGSRPPECYANWQQILVAAKAVAEEFQEQPVWFLGAIAPGLDLATLQTALAAHGWQASQEQLPGFPEPIAPVFIRHNAKLILSPAFGDCLHWADWAIAMAGTATEQFIGLGKPAFIIPGQGPQFTARFAEAQTRLLGESVILVADPAQVGQVARKVLQDDRLNRIAENGRRRMGTAGAAQRIAECLMQVGQQLREKAV